MDKAATENVERLLMFETTDEPASDLRALREETEDTPTSSSPETEFLDSVSSKLS